MKQISTYCLILEMSLLISISNAFWRNLGFLQTKEIAPFWDGYTSLTLHYETDTFQQMIT